MKGMACLVGLDAGKKRTAYQGEVANQVESLVPAEFVREPQWTVHHAVFVQHDSVVQRASADQSHSAQAFKILHKSEGSGGREDPAERLAAHFQFDFLR